MFEQTRREFLKTTAGAISLLVTPIHMLEQSEAAVMSPPGGWDGGPGKARWRIDGLSKVTGQKIYARDFHARDLPGWPIDQNHVLVLRTPFAARLFDGVDLNVLPKELQPQQVVTAEDLIRDGIGVAEEEYRGGRRMLSH